jgi:protein-tyrosine-phosphatase
VAVSSGGIAPFARDGSLVSLDARFVLREIGIDLPEGAGATDLKRHPDHIEAADVILAMTEEQRGQLAAKFPASAGKRVLLVRELVGETGDIDDPSMKDEDVFRFCRDEIVRCLDGGLDMLLAHLEG